MATLLQASFAERSANLIPSSRGQRLNERNVMQRFAAQASGGSSVGLSAQADASAKSIERLSSRQRDVLLQMMAGALNKQIAYRLGISERTVKMHRMLMLRSLGVTTSAEAVRIGTEACFASVRTTTQPR